MEKNSGQDGTTGTYTPNRSARIKGLIAESLPLIGFVLVVVAGFLFITVPNPYARELGNAVEEMNTARKNTWTDLYNNTVCQQEVLWSGMTVDATISDDLKVVRIEMDGWSATYRQMNNGWVDRTNVWKKPGGGNAERSTLISHMPSIVEDCRR